MQRILVEIIDGIAIEGFIPDSGLGVAVHYPLRALYAVPPIAWSIVDGALPDGWTLDAATGEVAGATEDAGEFSVTIHAEDWLGFETQRSFAFRVQALPLALSGALPDMTVGTPYSHALTLSGGVKPRIATLSTLPADTSIVIDDDAGTATVQGTATGTGLGPGSAFPFDVSITIEDAGGAETTFEQLVDVNVTPVVWAPTYPAGQVGVAYDHTPVAATGGTGGITYSRSGSLPPGLAFVGATGRLHGNPTTDGGSPYVFDAIATDSEGNVAIAPQSVAIADVPKVQVLSWTGNGAGARAIATNVDLSSGGVWWDYASTGMRMCQSATGSTWWSFNPASQAAADPVSTDYSYAGGSMTVPSSRNALGVQYQVLVVKKEAGLCDVLTYNGTGINRLQAHGLGVTPASVFVRKLVGGTVIFGMAQTGGMIPNDAAPFNSANMSNSTYWNSGYPDSANISLGSAIGTNGASRTYIAVLFGSHANLHAGTYAGNGGASPHEIADFEADFVLTRNVANMSGGGWSLFDQIRNPGFASTDQPFVMSTGIYGTAFNALTLTGGRTYVDSVANLVNAGTITYFFLAATSS